MSACERCGRLVTDGATDFGLERMFVLRPTCEGIEVRVDGEGIGYVSAEELRAFLSRSYGDPEDRMRFQLKEIRDYVRRCLGSEGRHVALQTILDRACAGLEES